VATRIFTCTSSDENVYGARLRGRSQKTISGFWSLGFPLTLGIFSCIFRLLQQKRIHFVGVSPETPRWSYIIQFKKNIINVNTFGGVVDIEKLQ